MYGVKSWKTIQFLSKWRVNYVSRVGPLWYRATFWRISTYLKWISLKHELESFVRISDQLCAAVGAGEDPSLIRGGGRGTQQWDRTVQTGGVWFWEGGATPSHLSLDPDRGVSQNRCVFNQEAVSILLISSLFWNETYPRLQILMVFRLIYRQT